MHLPPSRTAARAAALLLALALLASACGGGSSGAAADDPAGQASDAAADAATAAATGASDPGSDAGGSSPVGGADEGTVTYPLTIDNCGEEVVLESAPERIVLLESAIVPALSSLGVLDRAVARAGAFPREYYDDATWAALEEVPSLGSDLDESGHLNISVEVIIDQEPDLVLGLPDGISREALAAGGVPALVQDAYCPEGLDDPGFDDVEAQLTGLGEVFDRTAAAEVAVEDLRARVEEVTAAADTGAGRTAAALFPTVGGGSGYAYGSQSMTNAQIEAAGFENAFGDVDERVFEVTLEELLDRNPDVLILLHVDGEPGPVEDAVTGLPGAEGLTAVANGDILTMLFNFGEPPTPLALDGLERIAEAFGS